MGKNFPRFITLLTSLYNSGVNVLFYLLQALGTIDDLFVRKDVPLADERRKNTKDEL